MPLGERSSEYRTRVGNAHFTFQSDYPLQLSLTHKVEGSFVLPSLNTSQSKLTLPYGSTAVVLVEPEHDHSINVLLKYIKAKFDHGPHIVISAGGEIKRVQSVNHVDRDWKMIGGRSAIIDPYTPGRVQLENGVRMKFVVDRFK